MTEKIKRNLLRMDLQTFAEPPADEPEVDEPIPADEPLNPEEPTKEEPVDKKIPYGRFKAKVDEANALKEKLRLFEESQEEAQRKELEDKQAYKELYEKALLDAETAKKESLAIKKDALLTGAGYSQEQAKLLVNLVDGEDVEAIAESIKLLQATIPAQDSYADPSLLNGKKEKPETVGPEEHAKTIYERIKNKIR